MARHAEVATAPAGAPAPDRPAPAWRDRIELVRIAARNQALYRAGVRIFAAADYDALFDAVLERLWSLLKVDMAAVFLAKTPDAPPACRALRSAGGTTTYPPEEALPTAFTDAVWRGETTEAAAPHPLVTRFRKVLPEAGPVRVLVGANIVSAGGPLGVLTAGRYRQPAFLPDHRDLLSALAEQSALALAKMRVLEAAAEDGRRAHEMVSVTSHELRTPLTALQGFSELLLSRQVDADVQKSWLALINQESVRLGILVGELLDLSRIESGRLCLNLDVLNVGELLQDVARLWSSHDGARRDVRLHLAPDLTSVVADTAKVRQVISNLVSNAIKYSPPMAPVRLEAAGHCLAGRRARHPWSGGPAPSDCLPAVSIAVRDDGVGLTADDIERVFQPFYRAASTEVGGPAGAGLGLTISRRIVEWHGGRMWVESRPGRGSSFGLCLPAEPPVEVAPPRITAA